MLQKEIHPVKNPLRGSVKISGSKSISNRALLLAALTPDRTILRGLLDSDDTAACLSALQQLGIEINLFDPNAISIVGSHTFKANSLIDCRDAGTVARFLIPLLAAMGGEYEIRASPRMSLRPMKPLFDCLEKQGVTVDYLKNRGLLPVKIKSQGLPGGEIHVNIRDSSQFVSGLMLAAPLTKAGLIIRAEGLATKPYIQMTAKMMEDFGVKAEYLDNDSIKILPAEYVAQTYSIEPDVSTASYFFAAAALTKGEIYIDDIRPEMLQGDLRFLEVLEKMGAQVHFTHAGVTVSATQKLKGLDFIDMTGFTDTFMTLAAIAPFAEGKTTIQGLAHTRLQESDRVAAMTEGLTRLGAQVENTVDSITIYPGPLHSGDIDSHNDHRIAMSHALIGLKVAGVVIHGADCVKKTCPQFFDLLESLYIDQSDELNFYD